MASVEGNPPSPLQAYDEARMAEMRVCGKLMGGSCQSGMHTDTGSIDAAVFRAGLEGRDCIQLAIFVVKLWRLERKLQD